MSRLYPSWCMSQEAYMRAKRACLVCWYPQYFQQFQPVQCRKLGPFAETLDEMTVGRRARYGPCVPINGTSKNLLARKKHRRRHFKLVYLVGSPSSPKALPQLLVYVCSMLYFNLSTFFGKGTRVTWVPSSCMYQVWQTLGGLIK